MIAKPELMAESLKEHKADYIVLAAHSPLFISFHRHTLSLQPLALEQFDLSEYDLVISSESGPAKGVLTSPRTLQHLLLPFAHAIHLGHVSQIFAGDAGDHRFFVLAGPLIECACGILPLRHGWGTRLFTNSKICGRRAFANFIGRDAVVIHPPVQVKAVAPSEQHEDFLSGGR